MTTQLEKAKKGIITKEIKKAASNEEIEFYETSWTKDKNEYVAYLIKNGWSVIPANKEHIKKGLEPIVIGDKHSVYIVGYSEEQIVKNILDGYDMVREGAITTKINANIGISPEASCLEEEIKKMETAIKAGADTIMDLSVHNDPHLIDHIRKELIQRCKKPFGTVPIYQAYIEAQNKGEDLNIKNYLKVFEKHAKDGVDFTTVHAGITRKSLGLLRRRLMPTVSRGGGFILEFMKKTGKENFLYAYFDEILEIAKEYDVTLSLGDALRPGCLQDETDEAQLYELEILGELVERAREKGVQVMIEGPGHIPLNKIPKNILLEKSLCKAPFYVLGPLGIDNAAPFDHIASAIGGALAAYWGADFLCYVTPAEHIGLPKLEEVKQGVIAAKIAASIADYALGNKKVVKQSNEMSIARAQFNWSKMAELSLFPEEFKKRLKKEKTKTPHPCSMCKHYCPLKRKDLLEE